LNDKEQRLPVITVISMHMLQYRVSVTKILA